MSRTDETVKNYIVILITEIVVFLMGLWCRALFVQKIGSYFLGINGLLTSIFQILALSNLGLGDALAYSMIQAYAHKNNDRIAGIYNFSKLVYKIIIVILLILAIGMAFLCPLFVRDVNDFKRFYLYYIIFILSKLVTYCAGPYSTVLRADQKIRVMKKGELAGYILTTLLQIIFMYVIPSYALYLSCMVLASIITNLYVKKIFKKDYSWLIDQEKEITDEDKKKIAIRVKDVFISRLSSAAVDSTDNILTSKFVGLQLVGIYSNYTMIVINIRSLAKNLYTSMESGLGNVNALSNKKEIAIFYRKILLGYQVIAVVLSACIYVLIQDFIRIWLGNEYLLSQPVLLVLIIDLYVNILMYAQTCFINTTDLFTEVKTVYFVGAVINVIMSIILGLKMGLFGILFATLFSRLVCNFPIGLYLLCKKQMEATWIKEILRCIFYLCQMFAIGYLINYVLRGFYVSNYFVLIIKAIIAFILSFLSVVLLNIRNKDLKFYKEKILYILKKHGVK